MSVKAKDRNLAQGDCIQKSRELVSQILILTRPRQFDEEGKQIQKPGLLGEGQPLMAFGYDLLRCGKSIHAACYTAVSIKLKDIETLNKRKKQWERSIELCDSIMRQIDICIYQYARNNQKHRNSFQYLAKLTYNLKQLLYDRINRDNLIYEQVYKKG